MPATDNKAKMDAAVQRWVSEAQNHPEGLRLLRRKVSWFNDQIRILGDRFIRTPSDLEGLTAVDLMGGQDVIKAGIRAMTRAPVAQAKAA